MERALVVDDSGLIRKNIRTELERLDYSVIEAGGCVRAQEIMSENYFDMVILDMSLPDGCGLELCRKIKNNPANEKTIVMIMTSAAVDDISVKCFKHGAFGFFRKNSVRDGFAVFLKNITDFIRKCNFEGLQALVVEDSGFQRNFVTGFLKKIGINAVGTETFGKAVKLINDGYFPDLVIIDNELETHIPMTDFICMLRNKPECRNIPIIAITTADDREIRNRLFYAGVNDYFHKPFDLEEFYLRIRAHLINKIHLDDMEKKQKNLRQQAVTDELTGLYNRRYFFEALNKEDSRYRRTGSTYSMIMFDIDHFKRVNDKYGHSVGDEVLREIAEIAVDNVRYSDIAARYGGEEFVIILPNTDKDGAFRLAEKLRKAVEDRKFASVQETVTSSFGVACIKEVSSCEKMVNLADSRLYCAKNMGRNIVIGADIKTAKS